MPESDERQGELAPDQPNGFQHRRLGIAIHLLVILGSAFLVVQTDDAAIRVVSILVCAVSVLAIVVLLVDPAGRRRRSQG